MDRAVSIFSESTDATEATNTRLAGPGSRNEKGGCKKRLRVAGLRITERGARLVLSPSHFIGLLQESSDGEALTSDPARLTPK